MSKPNSPAAEVIDRRTVGGLIRFLAAELKPKGKVLTPFNVVTAVIMLAGAAILVLRFSKGIGAIADHDQHHPWGLWIGFNVITGVAFAGGAYIITFMVYMLNMKKYHPIVRVTVLNGFLAYVFYAGALLLDLGRPWNVVNPIIGNSFGFSSVLFLVAWHFLLYMMAELIEFFPTVAEWLGWRRVKKVIASLTIGAVIFGITLSSLHQSGLGALFLMAKNKIHPLWYTEFIPVLFLVSSVFAGLSLVIFEGTISQRVFSHRMDDEHRRAHQGIVLGLGKTAAAAMFVYLVLKALVLVHGKHWALLATPMGTTYLVEVIGLTLVPCVVFVYGVRRESLTAIRVAALLTMAGIILNRLNVSIFAYRWNDGHGYPWSWMEVTVILAIISAQIWVFRWVVNRMPVMGHPAGKPAVDLAAERAQRASA
jgi:Ni/Fe-hydrogenase subunit HybB-like protein